MVEGGDYQVAINPQLVSEDEPLLVLILRKQVPPFRQTRLWSERTE